MPLPNISGIAAYGGALVNAFPVENPQTDRDAGAANGAYADIAAMTQTQARAWVAFSTAVTTGGMAMLAHGANWGNSNLVAPALSRFNTGIFQITWPATVTDELSNNYTLNLLYAAALQVGANTAVPVTPYFIATGAVANVVTLNISNQAGTLSDAAGAKWFVWVR